MANILVTGAAGFIGSHTAELLLTKGHRVIGVDNLRTGKEANLAAILEHPAFRFHPEDVAEPGTMRRLATEIHPEVIIHLAALVSVPESIANPALNQRLNLEATRLVAEAAAASGSVRRIVFASSAAVYGDNPNLPLGEDAACRPLSPYGQAKLDSERLLLEQGQANSIVVRCQRYFNVYGPRQDPSSAYSGVISRFVKAMQERQSPHIHGDGQQTRDFAYVADVARANLLAATSPEIRSGIANVCSGSAVSLLHLVTALAKIMDSPVKPTFGPARAGDIRHSVGSPAAAKVELNFTAVTPLEAGLRAMLRH